MCSQYVSCVCLRGSIAQVGVHSLGYISEPDPYLFSSVPYKGKNKIDKKQIYFQLFIGLIKSIRHHDKGTEIFGTKQIYFYLIFYLQIRKSFPIFTTSNKRDMKKTYIVLLQAGWLDLEDLNKVQGKVFKDLVEMVKVLGITANKTSPYTLEEFVNASNRNALPELRYSIMVNVEFTDF